MDGVAGIVVDLLDVIGIGVVVGLMVFGFLGQRVALTVGVLAAVVSGPFVIGFLHDYATLSGSLVAYAVSTIVCAAMSFRSEMEFDLALIKQRTGAFETGAEAAVPDAGEDRKRKRLNSSH